MAVATVAGIIGGLIGAWGATELTNRSDADRNVTPTESARRLTGTEAAAAAQQSLQDKSKTMASARIA